MRRWVLICLFVLALGTGAGADNLTQKQKLAAKKLYQNKCTKCHRPYEPAAYTNEEWDFWMQKMRKKAKLKPNQEALLDRYQETARKEKACSNPDVGFPNCQAQH